MIVVCARLWRLALLHWKCCNDLLYECFWGFVLFLAFFLEQCVWLGLSWYKSFPLCTICMTVDNGFSAVSEWLMYAAYATEYIETICEKRASEILLFTYIYQLHSASINFTQLHSKKKKNYCLSNNKEQISWNALTNQFQSINKIIILLLILILSYIYHNPKW